MMDFKGDRKKYTGNGEDEFRHYILLVKIYNGGKTELQNLEIFTTGLKRLLELRRLHTLAFKDLGIKNIHENVAEN